MLRGRWSYYALYIPTLILTTAYLITLGIITPFRPRMEVATLWGEFAGRFWLKWGGGIDVDIIGQENIPDEPFVILANHQSEWETLFLPRIFRPTSIVLKASLTRIPIYGWAMKRAQPIAVDRDAGRSSIQDILVKGEQRLKTGKNVLIFAESKRVPPNSIQKYTRTGSKLAINAGAPVLPVVHNSGDCWSPKRWFRPGKITLIIGKPIYPGDSSATELTSTVRLWAQKNYPGELDIEASSKVLEDKASSHSIDSELDKSSN